MLEQLSMCGICRHKKHNECYLQECIYEPMFSCNGCIDSEKKTYKGTKCLSGCKRYPYNPDVVTKELEDHYRKEKL